MFMIDEDLYGFQITSISNPKKDFLIFIPKHNQICTLLLYEIGFVT